MYINLNKQLNDHKNLLVSILHLTKLLSRFVSDATHLLYQLFTHQKPQELTHLDPLEQKY